MPYVKQAVRNGIDFDETQSIDNAGELNYKFTKIILSYLGPKPNYQAFNDVIGALEGCKLELYRRMVAPYEDTKIEQNGDVYPV